MNARARWVLTNRAGDVLWRFPEEERARRFVEEAVRWWGIPSGELAVEELPGEPPHEAGAKLFGLLANRVHEQARVTVGPRVRIRDWGSGLLVAYYPRDDLYASFYLSLLDLRGIVTSFANGDGAKRMALAFDLPTPPEGLYEFILQALLTAPIVHLRGFPPRTHLAAVNNVPIAPGTTLEEARRRGEAVLAVMGIPPEGLEVHEIKRYGVRNEEALLRSLDELFWSALLERVAPQFAWGRVDRREVVGGVRHVLQRAAVGLWIGEERYIEVPTPVLRWHVAAAYDTLEKAGKRFSLWTPSARSFKEAVEAWHES